MSSLPPTASRSLVGFVLCVVVALMSGSPPAHAEPVSHVGPANASPRLLRYRERTDDSVVYLASTERAGATGLTLTSVSDAGEEHTVVVTDRLESVSWRHRFPARDTDYTAVRTGRLIELRGRSDGRSVDASFTLHDDAPWIQSIERSLREFALSADRRVEFWTIQPGDFQLRKLQAVRRSRATIAVDGIPTEAWEIRLSLPGIGSVFWSATYWFRTADGLFVRSEAVRGWPGTPVTTVELIMP